MEEKDLGGRPTKYKKEYDDLAFKYCLLGATDEQLAEFLDIAVSTLNKWKHDFPSFIESIQKGKTRADAEVAAALYKKATGYRSKQIVTASFDGEISVKETDKIIEPDTAAAFIWLKNRQSGKWREKHEINVSTEKKEIADLFPDEEELTLSEDEQKDQQKP